MDGFEQAIADLASLVAAAIRRSHEPRATQPLDSARQVLAASLVERRSSLEANDRLRVALVGRTKAGKSQLVAALTGDEEGRGVGIGRHRTTTAVRVTQLEDFDLIDTPGVAALEGDIDTEVALEAADQADAVLWVYAESLQDEEADSLAQLLHHGKPTIVAFNAKGKVDSEAYRRVFQKHPARTFRDLTGHETRVQQVAERAQARAPEFVAFHGRAAWWAHRTGAADLRQASRIQDLLDACQRALVPRAEGLRIQRDHDIVRHRLVQMDAALGHASDLLPGTTDELRATLNGEMQTMLSAASSAHENALSKIGAAEARTRGQLRSWLRNHASASSVELGEAWIAFLDKSEVFDALDSFAEEIVAESKRRGRAFEVASQLRTKMKARAAGQAAPTRGWRGRLRTGLRVLGNAVRKFTKDLVTNKAVGKVLGKLLGRAVPGAGWAIVVADGARAVSASVREETARHAREHDSWREVTIERLERELTWATRRARKQLRRALKQVEEDIRSHQEHAVMALDCTEVLRADLDRLRRDLADATRTSDDALVRQLLALADVDVVLRKVIRAPGKRLQLELRGERARIISARAALDRHFMNEEVVLMGDTATEEDT